jgi:iron only hydrogenase large subunit-like protein
MRRRLLILKHNRANISNRGCGVATLRRLGAAASRRRKLKEGRVAAEYLKLKESNCRNCYKCIRHCPVKAISFGRNQAHIVADECILCGECFVICPQNAKSMRDDLPAAKKLLREGSEVYASVAPSVAAAFPGAPFESVRAALMKLGFAGAEETALGATAVKKRYERLVREGGQRVVITTCCHSVVALVQKHYPAAAPCLAKVASPMLAHGKAIKSAHPKSKVVFVGPCVSKKAEAEEYPGAIDCVLTFEDVALWLEQERVALPRAGRGAEAGGGGARASDEAGGYEWGAPGTGRGGARTNDEAAGGEAARAKASGGGGRAHDEAVGGGRQIVLADAGGGRARMFPTAGGILDSMDIAELSGCGYSFLAVDGVKNCVAALEDVAAGNLGRCFIEMSACAGSCVGGPAMGRERRSPIRDRMAVRRGAGREDFDVGAFGAETLERGIAAAPVRRVRPGGKAIADILRKTGKTLPEHELNCGSCGYETCREKAEAVLSGKAEIAMCLPYLMARAESFSDNVIGNTPNGVIVLNRSMEIQQINAAARRLMNIADEKAVLGRNVACVLDPSPFMQALGGPPGARGARAAGAPSGAQVAALPSGAQTTGLAPSAQAAPETRGAPDARGAPETQGAQAARGGRERHVYLAEYGKHVSMAVVADPNYDIIIGFMRDVTAERAERAGKDELGRKAAEIADRVIERQMRAVQEIASLLGETTAETKVALERLKSTLRE